MERQKLNNRIIIITILVVTSLLLFLHPVNGFQNGDGRRRRRRVVVGPATASSSVVTTTCLQGSSSSSSSSSSSFLDGLFDGIKNMTQAKEEKGLDAIARATAMAQQQSIVEQQQQQQQQDSEEQDLLSMDAFQAAKNKMLVEQQQQPQQQEEEEKFDGYAFRDVILSKWGACYDVDFQRVDSFGFRDVYLNVLPYKLGKMPWRHDTELDYLCHLQAIVEILEQYNQLDYVLYQISDTNKVPRGNTSPLVAVPLRLDLTDEQKRSIMGYR